ncbi:histidine phosphotransferase ChpT [Phreatobacter oligotrophus]|jgi:histidine phosphotransferase ChpT|uniref:Histidine phosphotransferase ChpT n=1 Tax=Phreatobacter oligotrophus TaxID=1122261 RepID=A0A2T4Z1F6_9HYPH|nr:histidine phosphotransferase family protein [Phreatobacter oligotrophus]PTM53542.1 histidine phosphotransferase ChpT [Phreatobacter oligotrophus]
MADAPRSPVSLEGLDLAALVASRVCHDVISPVGAIVNGLELMEDGADEATTELALDLIRKSAKTASARLQFCRIAFGAAGSAGSAIDTRDAHQVAANFLNDDRTTVDWHIPPAFLPKNRVKLLLNLMLLAAGAIPRGGTIKVTMTGEGDTAGFDILVTGLNARVPPHAVDLLAGIPGNEQGTIDAHAIQPYYAGLLARAAGMTVRIEKIEDRVEISAA